MRNQQSFSVLLADVDRFKQVNDNFGHDAGDAVLKSLSERFRQTLRKQDVAARWGGEEFLVFLPHTRTQYAKQIAENLRVHLSMHDINKLVRITVSIGVAGTSPGDEDIKLLIKEADQALYLAKSRGRNRVVLWNEAEIER